MILGQDIWALDSGSRPWRCKGFSYNCKKNNHESWRQVPPPPEVTFNMLDAASTCVWAVDFEYYAYIFVKECDIPIRFQDYKFQYERWYLGRGWRPARQDEDPAPRNLSHHWTADSVWRIDRNIDGVPTDRDGWQYAAGFGSTFTNQNFTTNVVRRKRLAKYFTYNKMGRFARITSDQDHIKFLDIAAGGTMMTGSENWPISVWGVSKDCKVYFRTNVSNINPEGDSWKEVCQPDFSISKLSVGPRGQMWGITTNGEMITRSGIDSEHPTGTEWIQITVAVPGMNDIYPTALTISAESVWMIDCKGRVFFHKGAEVFVHNTLLLTDKHDKSSKSKWVHMVMEPENIINFKSLSCGPENQVWGLDHENRIFNRADISVTQIAGQKWELVEDPKLKTGKTDVDSSSDSESEDFSPPRTMTPHGLRRNVSLTSFMTAKSLTSQYTVYTGLPKFAQDSPDRYSYTESTPDDGNLREPDELFRDGGSESDYQDDTPEYSTPSSKGVHYWKMISAGGCQGVGVKKDDVTLKQAELSKGEIAEIKECRNAILDRLREQSMRIRAKQFDNFDEMFDDGGFKLRSNAKIEMNGVMRNATVYLSKNIPHGHLRFRVFTPGAAPIADTTEDDSRRLGARRRMNQYEPTVVINQTSTTEQVEQVPLVDLFGIKRISPNLKQHTLLLFTAKRSYKLTFDQDTDCTNWFDRVNEYVRAVHEIPNVPPNQSVWALSGEGTVYFSPPVPSCVTDHSKRAWLPIEGNFEQISAGPRSIVWGVTSDNNLYCFTRGYGGGSHQMGENLESLTVQRYFQCTENQRYRLLVGFQPCAPGDRMNKWVDQLGNSIESENQYRLPLSSWRWVSDDWTVKTSADSDPHGWHYAKNFHSPFSGTPGGRARKRHYIRLAQMNCTAPWRKIPANLVKIARVTLEQYCFKTGDELVVAWALCTNGSLLYRHGVTPNKPHGDEWVHVDIDHPLVDISLDAFNNLWAVCNDGSAYFRMGVSEEAPTGSRWMHIVKPERDSLTRISAGKYAVWALGSSGSCYLRTKISSIREFGEAWSLVESEPMKCVSVSGSDQVFGITEKNRAIVSRDGVTGDMLKGEKWSNVVQDVWSDICITATTQQHHWDQIDELTSMAMTRYRQQIWVKLREKKLCDNRWREFHRYCPPIFTGDRVCIRGTDGTWTKNIIDHVAPDDSLKIRISGLFSTTYETVGKSDVIRDEPPDPTHLAVGTQIIAKLSILSGKYSPCVVKSIDKRLGLVRVDVGSQYRIREVRIPNTQLSPDIYFLDGKRKHSVTNDEFGREIAI